MPLQIKTRVRAKHQWQQKGKPTSFVDLDEDYVKEVLTGTQQLTRRKVLSLVMTQYDPLGLLSPLMVQAKLLLRSLYGKGKETAWDTPLPQEQARKWASLLAEANRCPELEFPRSLRPEGGAVAEVVAFWDGSLEAHGACVY